jgi:hypothetical protein
MNRTVQIPTRARRWLVALLLVCAPFVAARAQDKPAIRAVEVDRHEAAEGDPVKLEIRVIFNQILAVEDRAAATNPANYSIIDTVRKRFVPVCDTGACAPRVLFPGDDPAESPSIVLLQLTEELPNKERLPDGTETEIKNRYYIQVSNLSFGGKPVEDNLLTAVDVSTTQEQRAKIPSGIPSKLGDNLDTADDREDANYYLSGEVTRASGTDFNGSVDIKVEHPFATDFWGTSHWIGPVFDLRANSDPEADPDSVKFGANWRSVVAGQKGRLQSIFWENDGLIESDRGFDNTNLRWGSKFIFPLKTWQDRRARKVLFYVRPFIGTELGKNLRSPVPEADGKGLARIVGGSTLNLKFPLRRVGKDSSLSLEALYERRWLLKREVSFEELDDGSLKSVTFGTNPRDWVEAKVIFKFNKFFGPFIGYEYGEQPPAFKLVDHKMKIGLIVSAKRKQ